MPTLDEQGSFIIGGYFDAMRTVGLKMHGLFSLRAYAGNDSAHNVRAYEGKPLRMCRIVP